MVASSGYRAGSSGFILLGTPAPALINAQLQRSQSASRLRILLRICEALNPIVLG